MNSLGSSSSSDSNINEVVQAHNSQVQSINNFQQNGSNGNIEDNYSDTDSYTL